MTIVAIIPARSGSKSVKDKNLLRLENRTLLEWSIMAAKKSKMVDEVVVSTDSSLYAEIATSAGASVPFLRPKELSRDRSTDSEFVFHILSQLKEKDHYPEYFIHLRPTTPLRIPSIIDEAIETFIGSNFTSLRSAHKMPESAYKYFEKGSNNEFVPLKGNDNIENLDSFNDPKQSFPETYAPNGYVDILSVKHIENTKLIHGSNVYCFETDFTPEVDSIEEFRYIEYLSAENQIFYNSIWS